MHFLTWQIIIKNTNIYIFAAPNEYMLVAVKMSPAVSVVLLRYGLTTCTFKVRIYNVPKTYCRLKAL